jgi:hypothetical protein
MMVSADHHLSGRATSAGGFTSVHHVVEALPPTANIPPKNLYDTSWQDLFLTGRLLQYLPTRQTVQKSQEQTCCLSI